MSLSRRLFALGGITLLPVIAVQALNEYDLRHAREQEVRSAVVLQAEQVAAEQQRILDGIRNVLRVLVELPTIRNQDSAVCNALFQAIRPSYDGFEALAAARADGSVFCASDRIGDENALPGIHDRHYFRQAMETEEFTVGRYAYGRRTATNVVHLAMPYRDEAGRPNGVVFVSLGLSWLAGQLGGPQWNAGRAFSLVDNAGTILVRQPDHARFVGKPFPHDLWVLATSAKAPGNYEVPSPLDGVTRIVGFIPPSIGPGGLYVGVGLSRAAAFQDLNAATSQQAIAIGLGALLSAWLAWLFGRRLIQKPIEQLVSISRRWRAGALEERSGMRGPSEFGQLGEAFDAMADDLGRALQHKDVLLRELNHRVMNSLQTISSLFALQARKLADPSARKQFDEAVGRVNSMALAYRRMHTSDGVQLVDFSALLNELCNDLSASLLLEGDHCKVEADPLYLHPDGAMPLALIVNELITNAVKHGGSEKGRITIKLGRSSEGYRLAVRNRGVLPPGYRPEANRGFGMQMVISMVRQLDGRLEASSMGGETEFAITFQPNEPQPPQLAVAQNKKADPEVA